jgi:biotin-(acetyl-CoA carboxylase) ligase
VRDEDFPEELRATATGMGREPEDVERILAELLDAAETRLAVPEDTLATWRERDVLLGREIAWSGGSGVAHGIDDGGRLLVRTSDGEVALDAGEVHLGVQ